jgi:hypothetical protein
MGRLVDGELGGQVMPGRVCGMPTEIGQCLADTWTSVV